MIADAPWIRNAEMNGPDDGIEVCCPICGWECETIWTDRSGDVCGCNRCMSAKDAYDWYQDEVERGRPE